MSAWTSLVSAGLTFFFLVKIYDEKLVNVISEGLFIIAMQIGIVYPSPFSISFPDLIL